MLKVGDILVNATKPEWGEGKIEKITSDKIIINFPNIGVKTLNNTSDIFILLQDNNSKSKNLCKTDDLEIFEIIENKHIVDENIRKIIDIFINKFPSGFNHEGYITAERNYKIALSNRCKELFERSLFEQYLANQDYEKVCNIANSLVERKSNNLLDTVETLKFRDALAIRQNQKPFAEGLFDLLHGTDEYQQRFDRFCNIMHGIGLNRWVYISVLPYLMYPEKHIFVKPNDVKAIIEHTHCPVQYNSTPTGDLYNRIIKMTRYIETQLVKAGFPPQDMIDMQGLYYYIKRL